ncbi:PH domain-containing protein [Streptoalloteichus tenebrarius]|uniref:PH domain-containing protein n=1 Tax=Streptoalloteichus tenebrarius (strain ATCC 17920 / DSM 40477 / JCM 4838 / CBS 697.72 / NBRC 16177 / NCIMB 11028 / NRRL B-12390 / A12253. 1 / ISP 5477) TaxID=1933 RepID=UPI0020A2C82B|nr:PH domain-containing protein [Streptoalloteichus tenebrarius]
MLFGEADLRLRPPRNRVDRRAVWCWTLLALVIVGPPVLTLALLTALIPPARLWLGASLALVAVPSAAYVLVMPRWRYRVHRWEVTDHAVYTASGWFWQKWRIAPMSRIQTVDTVRGPLQRLCGVAAVTVTTASAAGPIRIGGLDDTVASDLAEWLSRATEATKGDAT